MPLNLDLARQAIREWRQGDWPAQRSGRAVDAETDRQQLRSTISTLSYRAVEASGRLLRYRLTHDFPRYKGEALADALAEEREELAKWLAYAAGLRYLLGKLPAEPCPADSPRQRRFAD